MSQPGPPWRHPFDFRAARPLFVDAWPADWRAVALPHTLVRLDRVEAHALGAHILGCHTLFHDASPAPLTRLQERLDQAVATQGRDCFVRLSSRSPKDSLRALRHGLRVGTGEQALALFLEGSRRCGEDLRMSLDCNIPLALVVRPWLPFHAWQEWRVFMVGRVWAGASVRMDLSPAERDVLAHRAPGIQRRLEAALERLAPAAPVDNAAFDLVVVDGHGNAGPKAVLLDANPLGPLTDLGWFTSAATLDGGMHIGPVAR